MSTPFTDQISIAVFTAKGCPACSVYKPTLAAARARVPGLPIYALDVDTDDSASEIADKYSVRALPTTLFLRNGTPIGRSTGAEDLATLMGRITRLYPEVAPATA